MLQDYQWMPKAEILFKRDLIIAGDVITACFSSEKTTQSLSLFGIQVLSLTDLNFQECKSAFRWVRKNRRRTVIMAAITWGQRNVEELLAP